MGFSPSIPVTPGNLDTSRYRFSVSTNRVPNGLAFHITMTGKNGDIDTNFSDGGLAIVTHTKTGNGDLLVGATGPKPAIPVTLKKERRIWTADFVVPEEALDNPNLDFNFSFGVYRVENGKIVRMPAVDCCDLRLADFTGQTTRLLKGRWRTVAGDTYEFTDDGKFEHWLEEPPGSASDQLDVSKASNRKELSRGTFSVDGNWLILAPDNGPGTKNEFYLTKGEVDDKTDRLSGSNYSFIICSYQTMPKNETRWSILKYELMR